jgi:predicted outer membrane repeat protein
MTNITAARAVSQGDSNRVAVAVDATGVSSNAGESAVHYVWQSSPSPQPPYATPDTAGHQMQTVLDICKDGDTVLVYPGTYADGGIVAPGYTLTNRVCVTNDVLVQSVSSPDDTIIEGQADPVSTNGPGAVRGVYLTGGAEFSGFTIMNGHTYTNAATSNEDQKGGGVYMINGATLTNCVVTGCSAAFHGGGVYARFLAYIHNSELRGNQSDSFGGGAYLFDWAFIQDSRVEFNRADSYAGGLSLSYAAVAERCTIVSNQASSGGGIQCGNQSILSQCGVQNNTAYGGGGAWANNGCKMENSLFSGNHATSWDGGGIYFQDGGTLRNSTVSGNTASSAAGVFCNGQSEIVNSIIIDNASDNWGEAYSGTNTIWTKNCVSPDPDATGGNITNAPLFLDAAAGDYHIVSNSPCVDEGADVSLSTLEDLDGKYGPMDGDADGRSVLDIGCYEVPNSAGDSDEDGASDGDEDVADTDPYDPVSYLHITMVSNAPSATVFFDSSENRFYVLSACDDLLGGTWTNLAGTGPRLGTGQQDFMTDTNTVAGRFYRINVQKTP